MSTKYQPVPIDTERVVISPAIAELIEKLARNTHDNWAKRRMQEGWQYGPRRDDQRKQHPNLIPYEQLSESEKQYDRETALQTIKSLLAIGYAVEPPPASAVPANVTAPAVAEQQAALLQLLTDSSAADLTTLLELRRALTPEVWSLDPEPCRVLGQRMLSEGEPLIAYDVLAEGIKFFPQDVCLRQLLALALARSGASGAANALLERLYQEGSRDEETIGLLARTYKDLAREERDESKAKEHLRRAYDLYMQGYETSGGYWSGINAATLALLLGQKDHATALARQVREQCRQKLRGNTAADAERYWLISTTGEACLVLGDWAEAGNWYGQAVELGRGHWGNLQSTRHNARLLMQAIAPDQDQSGIEHLFRFPSVVIFVGHMIDRPERTVPRFPTGIEPLVREAIRQSLKSINAGFAYASAACGSDILFHEVIQEMKGESHVIMPYKKERFINDCVSIVPGDWEGRFEKIIAQAIDTQELSKDGGVSGYASYEFANLMLHGLASIRAQQMETKLVPIAVWDGKTGDGAGGTAATVERWRRNGLQVQVINLAEILLHRCPELAESTAALPTRDSVRRSDGPHDFAPEIRALLFADVEGFSKLNDEGVRLFVTHFLGLTGRLANESVHRPLSKNTWGDGLFFVFSNARDAGQFALDLCDAVRETNWSEHGLPNLKIRIGLHAGPVFFCRDPVTERTNYIGDNVSRAARIEPITPAGQVYASQPFAALAAAEGSQEFRCDYVGQTAMAKKYGTFPTYVVVHRR
jgi:class 3 adenylate cyclase